MTYQQWRDEYRTEIECILLTDWDASPFIEARLTEHVIQSELSALFTD